VLNDPWFQSNGGYELDMLTQPSSLASLVMVALGSFLLCGCNQTTGSDAVPVASVPAVANVPADPGLPEDAACTKAYTHYQTVLKADVATGNVQESVYTQIETELERASVACAAGHDAEARSLIHASQEKHGYHT
jgi:hypothetical protein